MTAVIPAGVGGQASGAPVTAHPVQTPSGKTINVLGQAEEDFYNDQATRYQSENTFTNASDLQDLDRLIFLELLIFRASSWLGNGQDYDGMQLSDRAEQDCRRAIKENSVLLTAVKNDLGLTKSQRDKAQYESVGVYLTDLRQRAKLFGVHREEQLGKMLALGKELFAIVGAFDRADEEERRKIGFKDEAEVLQWIRETMQPEFDALDAYFIANHQAFWKQV